MKINIKLTSGADIDRVSRISDLRKYDIKIDKKNLDYLISESERLGFLEYENSCFCNLDVEAMLKYNLYMSIENYELNADTDWYVWLSESWPFGYEYRSTEAKDEVKEQSLNLSRTHWIKVKVDEDTYMLAELYDRSDNTLSYEKVLEVRDEKACDDILKILTSY